MMLHRLSSSGPTLLFKGGMPPRSLVGLLYYMRLCSTTMLASEEVKIDSWPMRSSMKLNMRSEQAVSWPRSVETEENSLLHRLKLRTKLSQVCFRPKQIPLIPRSPPPLGLLNMLTNRIWRLSKVISRGLTGDQTSEHLQRASCPISFG
jgi:hypothetical protein